MSTEQQDTREQQIEALGLAIYAEKRLADRYRDTTTMVYDQAVARMIADAEQAAERRGAVKALDKLAAEVDSRRRLSREAWLSARAVENGAEL